MTRNFRSSVVAAAERAQGMEVTASHILFVGDDADDQAAKVLEKIKGDVVSFEDAASEHSQCPSRANGGSLGWFGRGMMVPEFDKVSFEADIGAIETVKTQFGTHLLRVDGERMPPTVAQMQVSELKEILDNPAMLEEVELIDVREEDEVKLASLPQFSVYSLSKAQEWGEEFFKTKDPKKKTVVMCHHGQRSMSLAMFLLERGWEDVNNVVGGIDAYASMDNSVPKY